MTMKQIDKEIRLDDDDDDVYLRPVEPPEGYKDVLS